eukprot:TRINITY_DN943_c0_g1_i1.p1 TRINITY_DN943_c0_g1~~TRINITY_DN943_c0_g1_i1.p1  ORF type:complete len:152 (+),score=25.72 TRINITY_DN943_c0_g1_i1:72-527(+)
MPQMSPVWESSKQSQSSADQGLKSLPDSVGGSFSPGSDSGMQQKEPRRLPQMTITKPTPLDISAGGPAAALKKQPFREPLPSPGRWALGGGASLISPSHHGLSIGWRSMFPSRMDDSKLRTMGTTAPSKVESPASSNPEVKPSSFLEWWSS